MALVFSYFVLFVAVVWPALSYGQGKLGITFDGPPLQVSGSQILVQQYFEQGMYFRPLPGSDGFARVWTGMPPEWPNNSTPYLQATTGDSLVFSFEDGSSFGVTSVDLAAFTTGLPNFTVDFVGYHSDGSTIETSFSGNGINFQTYSFGSDWSSGLSRVEIPNYAWSLDNLVVTVPEPSTDTLLLLGLLAFQFQRIKMIKRL